MQQGLRAGSEISDSGQAAKAVPSHTPDAPAANTRGDASTGGYPSGGKDRDVDGVEHQLQ